jgi:hypothetical protein
MSRERAFKSRVIRVVDLKKVDLDAKNVRTISMQQEETIEDLSGAAK